MKSVTAFAAIFFLSVVASAQTTPNPDDYERVLVPVFYFGPGAGSSQWFTRVAAINGGDTKVELVRPAFEGSPLCGGVCGCGVNAVMNPTDEKFMCQTLADPAGVVLFVPKNASAAVQFQSWIGEQSRGSSCEIQVVRQKDLRTAKSFLLNLPADPRYRVALRVFDAFSRDGLQVRVRALDPRNLDHIAIVETTLTLRTTIRTFVAEPFPWQPAFAMIGDLTAAYPQLLAYGNYFLEITPIKPLDSFWALATITNNETQQVTTVTPR
jgi:hypothetical protein